MHMRIKSRFSHFKPRKKNRCNRQANICAVDKQRDTLADSADSMRIWRVNVDIC
jgi:hypothetical protein